MPNKKKFNELLANRKVITYKIGGKDMARTQGIETQIENISYEYFGDWNEGQLECCIEGEWYFNAGLWFDNGVLTDYDGVYQLSKVTIKVIRGMGFTVPREFEG